MAAQTNWGIIYCPQKGNRRTQKRWKKIRTYLDERGVKYDYVQSEETGSAERLAQMMVENGYQTIVLVGGDSALNDALNGILHATDDLENITLALIPNGFANDFAHFWGFDERNYRQTVDWLIRRRVRTIDVGCCQYESEGQEVTRYFLDCINIGLAASIMNLRNKTRRFLGFQTLSFVSSAFLLLFQRMVYKMHVHVNEDDLERKMMAICIGSATGYGQTPNAVPYNGLLDVSVVSHPEIVQLFEGLWLLFTDRFLNSRNVQSYRTQKVEVVSTGKARIALDGKVVREKHHVEKLQVTIKQEALKFIIPT